MDAIRFLLNGKPVSVEDVKPTLNLLDWLRQKRALVGTKEGCAEGDCGACTVALAELDDEDTVRLVSVNACLLFVPALDGKAVFTIEFLREQALGGLHPVQQAMVDCHGAQCGFCTPGIVMSLWTLYHRQSGRDTIHSNTLRSALSGNLCRCTGYRPILEAGQHMLDLPPLRLDLQALKVPLLALRRNAGLHYHHAGLHFFAPRTLGSLLQLRAQHRSATLLGGCTDIGLWVNKQFRPIGDLIYLGQVDELKRIHHSAESIRIGAAVSLNKAFSALVQTYPQLAELWERFASEPIRNSGTLGGNVANGSPIGDSMPALIALGSRVTLISPRGERNMMLEDFYLDYQRKDLAEDEVLAWLDVPMPCPGLLFRSYKVSKRFDSDISAVCSGYALQLADGIIQSARLAYGGMAATPRRARAAEAAMLGRHWDQAAVAAARAALAADFAPLNDHRASSSYRVRVAANLLDRFLAETSLEDPQHPGCTSVHAQWQCDTEAEQ